MSFQDMAWAVVQKCSSPGQKLVLLMLANRTNGHTGQCNPSHKLLADECSMGLSTLKSHLSALESAGYLKIIHKSVDGVSLPNQYQLVVDRGVGQILAGVGQDLTGGGSDSDGGVGQILATKQEVKPRSEPINTSAITKPDDVSQSVWSDFVAHRKGKKAALTNTALEGIRREAAKAGWSMEAALTEVCSRGWTGFKASWVADKSAQMETFKERDARLGREKWERMTGEIHPDNNPTKPIRSILDVVDMEIKTLEFAQ